MKFIFRFLLLTLFSISFVQLTACSCLWGRKTSQKDGPPHFKINLNKIPNAIPKSEPYSRYGNPEFYTVRGHRFHVSKTGIGYHERGIASWYGTKFHGHLTSNREPYSLLAMTAASRTLPLPTYVQIVNLENHRRIIVKVNDRGPFNLNRIIDLSYVAAAKLGYAEKGTALVEVTAIDPKNWCQEKEKEREKAEEKEKTNLPNSSNPRLYLQVGAFAFENNANNLKKRISNLIKLSPNTHIRITETHDANGTPLYRVQLGPLSNVSQSDQLYKILDKNNLHPVTAVN